MLVVGGGVSGCAAAIRLRHLGFNVTLMERANFPREKICGCCLGAAGLSALDAIGLGDAVRQLGVATTTFVGYLQTTRQSESSEFETNRVCRSPVEFPVSPGVAIARSVLDSFLVAEAARIGVDVRQPQEAQIVRSDSRSVVVRHRPVGSHDGDSWVTTDQYAAVILATGLTGVFQGKDTSDAAEAKRRVVAQEVKRHSDEEESQSQSLRWDLPWVESPHGPLGIATHVPASHPLAAAWPIRDGQIQMVCGDDGYVGLVRLPDGSVDLAAALQSRGKSARPGITRRSPSERIALLLQSHPDLRDMPSEGELGWRQWLQDDAVWMTAPPLRRQRHVGQGRVVAIGDCVRYVEPLTGEGMTWGIESGIAVADLWQQAILDHAGVSDVVASDAVAVQTSIPSAEHFDRIDYAAAWQKRLATLQTKRRVICGLVTSGLRYRAIRRITHAGLSHAEWLAKPFTQGVASGPHFESTRQADH
ncbi:Dehydrogenase (flavoprotein) [Neorhodopirellula lusitana]|uniref:Dehydrogenase (Flavoprotein) n=1 Tax=Neorhodopirellula lusitana TaxID=445327 RepID=A0ABY1Q058_9BACT|nr:Dehydrogenase (flavoprotein) [Neorhodopirellula lusitana]